MIMLNISSVDTQSIKEINLLTGKPISFIKRITSCIKASSRFIVLDVSENIKQLLQHNSVPFCQTELRSQGIIIIFNVKNERYAWIIPFYKLKIFQNGQQYSLYSDTDFIPIKSKPGRTSNRTCIRGIIERKAHLYEKNSVRNSLS